MPEPPGRAGAPCGRHEVIMGRALSPGCLSRGNGVLEAMRSVRRRSTAGADGAQGNSRDRDAQGEGRAPATGGRRPGRFR